MKRVSRVLASYDGVPPYWHFCPGCNRTHPLPESWTFDGNIESPTYSPSFVHSQGSSAQCHYVLTAGVLNFCTDCWHDLKGTEVPLPEFPERLLI